MLATCFFSLVIAKITGLILLILSSVPVHASNGLNLIGFGLESVSMGGADLAVARDSNALNTNPAGLNQIPDRRIDLTSTVALPLDVRHQDGFGNDEEVSNRTIVLGNAGHAFRADSLSAVFGVGLFAQGGSGAVYRNLETAFGTRDEFSSLFRIARLSAGAAAEVAPTLSLGLGLSLLYADLNQKIFPETSFADAEAPERSFFGLRLEGLHAVVPSYKFGAMWKVSDDVTLGASYSPRVKLNLEGDDLVANLSALGLGKVRYHDVHARGLNLASEAGAGIAFRPVRGLLASFEVTRLDWSRAVRTSTLRASRPDHPDAPPVIELEANQGWRDQTVVAAGIEYEWNDRTAVRAGFNYGRNPIPRENLNPLLASIGQRAVTLGAERRIGQDWRLAGGAEYTFREKIRYTNEALPFGPGAVEVSEVLALHLALGRDF